MKSKRFLMGIAVALSMWTAAGVAGAAPPALWEGSMRAMVEQTGLVVEGDVVDISTTYDEVTGPRTVTTLSKLRVHRGEVDQVPETIELRSFGGPVPGGGEVTASHVATFIHGERYLVFLRNGDWRLSPVAGDLVFQVEEVAGKSIVVTGDGLSVRGVGPRGIVPGFTVFRDLGHGPRRHDARTLNPEIDGGMVARAMGVQELLGAVRDFEKAEGVSVNGTFPVAPTTDGPSWRIMAAVPAPAVEKGATGGPTVLSTGVFDDFASVDRDAIAAEDWSTEELLMCFAEPIGVRDYTPQDVPACIGGDL